MIGAKDSSARVAYMQTETCVPEQDNNNVTQTNDVSGAVVFKPVRRDTVANVWD